MPAIAIAFALAQALSQDSRFQLAAPLPTIPGVMVDSYNVGIGLAQQTARNQNLQARMMWIDATANIDKYNTEQKIIDLVAKIKGVGFNTIVLDIKPISGQVIYPSKLAPKLLEWKGKLLPADYDPVAIFVREAKKDQISLIFSLNAFSEGHRIFKVGPGYDRLSQQTVLYESTPVLSVAGQSFPINPRVGQVDPNMITVATTVPPPSAGTYSVVLARNGQVDSAQDYSDPSDKLTVPPGGSVLLGTGAAAEFLQAQTFKGQKVSFDSQAAYVPISERPEQQIPLMMNPNDPSARQYALDIIHEVVTNYPSTGVIYDDRLRYGGINADFSDITKQKFEQAIGKPVSWPDDVFKWTYTPTLTRGIRPGKYYDQWMAWRASVIRDYVSQVREVVSTTRPGTQFGAYVGSWYGEYPALGHNYASPDVKAGFWFLSPNYLKTGTAPLMDYLVTGTYYKNATIYDAFTKGVSIGSTVEAAGTLVNRLVDDQTWTYAGLMLSDFKDDPDGLCNAMQAACASTQGVMIFDLSHDIEPMWPVFARAFAQPRSAPHEKLDLLATVRARRKALADQGYVPPPIVIGAGSAGTGQ